MEPQREIIMDTKQTGWAWEERPVDIDKNHFKILAAGKSDDEDPRPVALVGRPLRRVFPVQIANKASKQERGKATRMLDLFLVELPRKDNRDPWKYLIDWCNTYANAMGRLRWDYFAVEWKGEAEPVARVLYLPRNELGRDLVVGDIHGAMLGKTRVL